MDIKETILNIIPRTRTITAKEISHKTDISKPRVNVALNRLLRDGLVDRERTAERGSPFKYSR